VVVTRSTIPTPNRTSPQPLCPARHVVYCCVFLCPRPGWHFDPAPTGTAKDGGSSCRASWAWTLVAFLVCIEKRGHSGVWGRNQSPASPFRIDRPPVVEASSPPILATKTHKCSSRGLYQGLVNFSQWSIWASWIDKPQQEQAVLSVC
jgi:hypothetical protein